MKRKGRFPEPEVAKALIVVRTVMNKYMTIRLNKYGNPAFAFAMLIGMYTDPERVRDMLRKGDLEQFGKIAKDHANAREYSSFREACASEGKEKRRDNVDYVYYFDEFSKLWEDYEVTDCGDIERMNVKYYQFIKNLEEKDDSFYVPREVKAFIMEHYN